MEQMSKGDKLDKIISVNPQAHMYLVSMIFKFVHQYTPLPPTPLCTTIKINPGMINFNDFRSHNMCRWCAVIVSNFMIGIDDLGNG